MITLEQLRTVYKPQILELAKKYGVTDIRVFGSVVRGEAKEGSDIDLLVNRVEGSDAWGIGGFYYDASELLGCKVDITTENALSKYLKDNILKEAQFL